MTKRYIYRLEYAANLPTSYWAVVAYFSSEQKAKTRLTTSMTAMGAGPDHFKITRVTVL